MRRALSLLVVLLVAVAAAPGCGNSVDAVDAPTPTPTATATPTPTGTPTGDLSGTYNVVATPQSQSCISGTLGPTTPDVTLTFNVPTVEITVSGGDFTPDWGFNVGTNLSLPDPEHGSITGSAFTAYYTYCDYNSLANLTTKHVTTWTGTFNQDGSFDSTLTQNLWNATNNQVATCGATGPTGTVTADMQQCTSSGISWQVHGEPQ